jgi:hypothetical protein
VIDTEKMKALAADLRKCSSGRYKWYAMGGDETSYFMDFDWGYDADRWFSDQQKSRSAWIEQEGIHIVKKLFQTELETNASEAADAIDTLLAALDQNRIDQLEAQGAFEELDRENGGLRAARLAYASELPPDAEGLPDVGNVHANIRKLKAALEAAAADKRDAERYRYIRAYYTRVVFMQEEGDEIDLRAIGEIGDAYEIQVLDQAVDAALSQRQEES